MSIPTIEEAMKRLVDFETELYVVVNKHAVPATAMIGILETLKYQILGVKTKENSNEQNG